VDTAALLAALTPVTAQAGLDVFEEEPLPADSILRSHPGFFALTTCVRTKKPAQLQRSAAEEVVRVCTGGLRALSRT
jgi:phosphoglycerate dehydrogenase-like enzyme